MHERYADPLLERRCLDCDDDGISPAELRLLEVNADDPPGAPAVLAALIHLEVVFKGRFHGFGVHSCPESVWAQHPENWSLRYQRIGLRGKKRFQKFGRLSHYWCCMCFVDNAPMSRQVAAAVQRV